MQIRVLFFASLSETLGKSEETITVDSPVSVTEVWNVATNRAKMPSNTLVAINQEYASIDAMLRDGDEVAFFPPVTGG